MDEEIRVFMDSKYKTLFKKLHNLEEHQCNVSHGFFNNDSHDFSGRVINMSDVDEVQVMVPNTTL